MAQKNTTPMSIHQYSKEDANEMIEGTINLQVDDSLTTQLRVNHNDTGKITPQSETMVVEEVPVTAETV